MREPRPLTNIWMRGEDTSFALSASDYGPLLKAWVGGEAFYSGSDLYGAPMHIKLSEVTAVCLNTVESQLLARADSKRKEPWEE